jgi:hypothetical protein
MIVKQTKPFVAYIGEHFFFPGNNEFNAEISAKLQEMPDFQAKVAAGQLQVIDVTASPAIITPTATIRGAVKIPTATVAKISVSNLAIASATKVIQGTFNKAELLRVQSIDQRKGIQDAITAQLARIDAMGIPAENKEES